MVTSLEGRFHRPVERGQQVDLDLGLAAQRERDIFDGYGEKPTTSVNCVGQVRLHSIEARHLGLGVVHRPGDELAHGVVTVVTWLELVADGGPPLVPCDPLQLFEQDGLSDPAKTGDSQVRWDFGRGTEQLREPGQLRLPAGKKQGRRGRPWTVRVLPR